MRYARWFRGSVSGIALQYAVAVRQSAIIVSAFAVGPRSRTVGLDVVRVDLEILGEISDGAGVVALLVIRQSAIVLGDGQPRVHFECQGELGDGFVILALLIQSQASLMVVGGGVFATCDRQAEHQRKRRQYHPANPHL